MPIEPQTRAGEDRDDTARRRNVPAVTPPRSALRPVVIVSPHFPPSTLAGVHRARHLAAHLPSHGWDPVIVRVDERHYTETADPGLAGLVRADLKQVRTGALPIGLTRPFGIGDIGLRAYRALGAATIAAVREQEAKVVMLTGSPFYPLLLAGAIKRATGAKILLDFQDPWVSAQGQARPLLSKGRAAHELSRLLEPRAVRHADFISAVSDTQNAEMAARYPMLDPAAMAAIPIGGDPGDFAALRRSPPPGATHVLDPDAINFSYVGTFMPRSGALMEAMLAGLRALRERQPALGNRIRLNFVGTSNQPSAGAPARVMPIAERVGVADLVRETPRRVAFLEALALLATSDGLMLIGSDEPHYTASKIYPNLMADRPYISLFHAASSAHRILTEAAGGASFAFDSIDQLEGMTDDIAAAFARIAEHPASFASPRPAAFAPFTADAVAARYAAIFDRLAR